MIRALRFIAGLLVAMGMVLGMSILSQQPVDAAFPGDPSGGGSGSGSGSGATSNVKKSACEGSGGTWNPSTNECFTPGSSRTVMSTIRQIVDILVFLVGAISVLMIIIGGVRYTVAQGDNAAVAAAKNTVLYAIVGVVVAFAAYGIVNFVSARLQ